MSVELKKFWMMFQGFKARRFLVGSVLRLLEPDCESRLAFEGVGRTDSCVCVYVGEWSVLSMHMPSCPPVADIDVIGVPRFKT